MKTFQFILSAALAIMLAVESVAQLCHGSFVGFLAFGGIFILALGGVKLAYNETKEED